MKCERCDGYGKVQGFRLYPGTHAHRPQIPCPACLGKGVIEPKQRYFRVKVEVIFPADGNAHADLLGREFVSEALSSMQYANSLPMGQHIQTVRHPAREVTDEQLNEGIDQDEAGWWID